MKRARRVPLVALMALALVVTGCKKEPKPEPKPEPGVTEPAPGPPGALPEDKAYSSGKVQAAMIDVETKVDLPNMGPEGTVGDELKRAQEGSVLSQTMTVTDDRGKMVFTTDNFYIPKGTELRYNPADKKYVLADSGKKTYWAMTGGEIGNLLEGGPAMTRKNYAIAITDTQEKETIAGLEAVRSDAELGFDWSVKTKTGEKKGKVRVKLAIWHSASPRLKEPWGKMMIDFLTVPFQDAEGQKVVDQLKSKVKFPLKWAMEVINESQAKEKGEAHPKLLTTAKRLEVKEVDKATLASPPAGFDPATGPYEFGEGGQTAPEELLAKIPAKKGQPPKDVEPPDKPDKPEEK